jgi:hypothetical protein
MERSVTAVEQLASQAVALDELIQKIGGETSSSDTKNSVSQL